MYVFKLEKSVERKAEALKETSAESPSSTLEKRE